MALQDYIPATGVYRHAFAKTLDDGSVVNTLPERLPADDRDDTILHIANGREFLWDLAQRYYPGQPLGWDLWEVIMQFQPSPFQDASVPIPEGTEVLIPSVEYIDDVYNGPSLISFPVI